MLIALVETKRAWEETAEVEAQAAVLAEEGAVLNGVPALSDAVSSEEDSEHSAKPRAVLGLSGVALGSLRAGTLPSKEFASAWAYFTLVEQYKPNHPPVRSSSSKEEMALARHLKKIGAACYTAWWCPHCQEQRESFGREAVEAFGAAWCSGQQGGFVL
eukprot:s4491_g2.t1